jgi:dienelactone hydrolase
MVCSLRDQTILKEQHMKKLILTALGFLNLAVLVCSAHAEKAAGTIVYFRSGDTTLSGCVYRPEGTGPFPAVVYIRTDNKPFSESNLPVPDLGRFYTSKGFVLFVPMHRSTEELKVEVNGVQADGKQKKARVMLPEFTMMTKDVAAAVTWIKSQAYVNESRVAVAGHGGGAIASLLLSQQDVGVAGYIAFSPAAQTWHAKPELHQALSDAIRESRTPIFLIQPQNDKTLAPSQALAADIARKNTPSLSKVYPPFGISNKDATNFGASGYSIWGEDVLKFLEASFSL